MVAAEEAQGQACVGPSDRQGWVWWQVGAGQSLSTAPGSSLVSVCQRSIRLSLFFRQSNQCFRRSPLALMPRTTPPAGGEWRGQPGAWAGGRRSHWPISPEPVLPPTPSQFPAPRPDSPPCLRRSKGGQWSYRPAVLLAAPAPDQGLGSCPTATRPGQCWAELGAQGRGQQKTRRGQGSPPVHRPPWIWGHEGSESSPRR